MCGITGVFEYGHGRGTVTEDVIVRMRDEIRHRGPDGEGLFVSPDRRWGAGHRRLAIVDLEGGAQPMFGERGECLVFNGEIYNYPELRVDLTRRGVRFRTTCDTEVILHLYRLHGEECVEHLNGMFAFALWDPARDGVFFARDHIGEKPFYWADVAGRFVFASEIKALLRHPEVTPRVNAAAIPAYLTNLALQQPQTLFAGINKLGPGTRGWCGRDGVRTAAFWDVTRPRRWRDDGAGVAAETVRSLLDDSVRTRLMSDVPVGVLLSGGLDSTALVALLHEQGKSLGTFSVGFENEPEIDERTEARWVADHFGTDHHETTVSEQDAIEFLPRLVYHQDEPLADPVCIPLNFVCELARSKGVKVVLAGEGADELFWGYPRYRRVMDQWSWFKALSAMPRFLRGAAASCFPGEVNARAKDLLQSIADGRMLPIHMPLGLNMHDRRKLVDAPGGLWCGWSPSDADGAGTLETVVFDTQEYEMTLRLPELLLMRMDRFSMAHSVEARVPFLDPRLVDYVYRLPLDRKLAGGQTKVVMRQALAGTVPERVLARKKQGFGAPILTWMGARLGTLLGTLADDDCLRAYFRDEELRKMIEEHTSGRKQNEWVLWPLLNFALWHKHWIEGSDLEPYVEVLRDKSPAART